MSQSYILRRDGRDYTAPDLETMRKWAQDGRVHPSDMVYSPRYQSWYRARDLRELRDVLPAVTPESGPPPITAPKQFWLRKGDQNYATDSLEGILRWAEEGNISPDDYIYHPAYGKWFRAGDSPQLVGRFPSHIARTPPFLPAAEDPMSRDASGAPSGSQPVFDSRRLGAAQPSGADLESADSVARTVMDFKAADLQKALRQQAGGSLLRGETTREGRKSETGPRTRRGMGILKGRPHHEEKEEAAGAEAAASPASDSRDGKPRTDPLPGLKQVAQEETAAEPAVEERPAPQAQRPSPPTPPAEAMAEAPAEDEEPRDQAPGDQAPVVDEDARFHDHAGLMKLFYDVARVFVVTRDLRPGELLETSCALQSTGDSFLGQAKRPIYNKLMLRMREHLEGTVLPARADIAADNLPGYERFVAAANHLIEVFREADEIIGRKPPERVVVGNVGRAKMSPEEEETMLRIDHGLKALIRIKAKKARAA